MKNVIKLIAMALLCLIVYSCQESEYFDSQSNRVEKARLWYETNHNLEMNKNVNFNGLPDWTNSFSWQNETYFPLIKERYKNKRLKTNKSQNRIYTRSFLVLKNEGESFSETLVVFTSKNLDEITKIENLKKLPKIIHVYDKELNMSSTQYVGSSFKESNPFIVNNGENTDQNFTTTKEGCSPVFAYATTCYSDGTCESQYLYTMNVCTGGGGGSSGGGSGGSGGGNTGGGGGGEDTPDPVLTNDNTLVITPRTKCESIKFIRKGNRLVAAIDKIRIDVRADGVISPNFNVRISFPSTVYISFPNNMSTGKAQKLAALAIQDVSYLVSKFIDEETTESSLERSPLQLMARIRSELKQNVSNFNGKAEYISDNSNYANTNIPRSEHETTYSPWYRNSCGE